MSNISLTSFPTGYRESFQEQRRIRCIVIVLSVPASVRGISQSFNMERFLCLALCVIAAAASASLPIMPWTEEDISAVSVISADYYNKLSGEDVIYKLLGNNSEYIEDEASSSRQLRFMIKETLCEKSNGKIMEDCAFKDNGVVKSCRSSVFAEKDRDIIVVTCDRIYLRPAGVRRSKSRRSDLIRLSRIRRGNRGGNGKRPNRGEKPYRPGFGSSIATVKNSNTGTSWA
ncbi:cathelicidin-related antimicrobial peptide Bf-CRAMP-like [Pseudophryne corroboree]|uniref:cathelicidin-related antimicrobial peptide Bf-CRAMP-like n=1 Tax=Pseudophryne corroboree TaxID=495146 RepID=UPI0030821F5B